MPDAAASASLALPARRSKALLTIAGCGAVLLAISFFVPARMNAVRLMLVVPGSMSQMALVVAAVDYLRERFPVAERLISIWNTVVGNIIVSMIVFVTLISPFKATWEWYYFITVGFLLFFWVMFPFIIYDDDYPFICKSWLVLWARKHGFPWRQLGRRPPLRWAGSAAARAAEVDESKVTYLPPAPRGTPAGQPSRVPALQAHHVKYLVFAVVALVVVAQIMAADAPQIVRVSGAVLAAVIIYGLSRVNWERYVRNAPHRLRAASSDAGPALLAAIVTLPVSVLIVWWSIHLESAVGLLIAVMGGSLAVAVAIMLIAFGFRAFMTLFFSNAEAPSDTFEILQKQNADTDSAPAEEDEIDRALQGSSGGGDPVRRFAD